MHFNKKNIVIVLSLLVLITISCFTSYYIYNTYFSHKEVKIIKTNVDNSDTISYFLEDYLNSETYSKKNDGNWDNSLYDYNAEKSYCSNGSILSWNNVTKLVSITMENADKCYLYFDKNTAPTLPPYSE